jgi:HEAT repeat protein
MSGVDAMFSSEDPDQLLEAIYGLPSQPTDALIEKLLDLSAHPDEDVREEAVRALFTKWKCDAFDSVLLDRLHRDTSPLVRAAAAIGLASSGTEHTRLARSDILLHVLKDSTEAVDVLEAAYDALVILWRHREGAWPFSSKSRSFDPQRDVDWNWVRSLEHPA